MSPDELKRLAAEASARHGIRIDPDDPLMAVVTLNRLAFEHVVSEIVGRIETATRNFEIAAEKVQVRAGTVLARELRECTAAIRKEIEAAKAISISRSAQIGKETPSSLADRLKWFAIGLTGAIGLVALGFWSGRHYQ